MIVDYDLESEYLPEDQDFNMEQYVEQDGTEGQITFVDRVKLHVARNQIVLEIAEDNVSYDNENFEIEFFTVDDEEEIVRNGVTVKDEKLTSLYLSRPGVDRARSLKTYFEVLYDNQVSMARDYDFETFIIEEPDDEEFCD